MSSIFCLNLNHVVRKDCVARPLINHGECPSESARSRNGLFPLPGTQPPGHQDRAWRWSLKGAALQLEPTRELEESPAG